MESGPPGAVHAIGTVQERWLPSQFRPGGTVKRSLAVVAPPETARLGQTVPPENSSVTRYSDEMRAA